MPQGRGNFLRSGDGGRPLLGTHSPHGADDALEPIGHISALVEVDAASPMVNILRPVADAQSLRANVVACCTMSDTPDPVPPSPPVNPPVTPSVLSPKFIE